MLDPHFDPAAAESRIFAEWEKSGHFEPSTDTDRQSFCIMIPPPNVTGTLHIGHAFNNTLQDILTRFERMRGKAVLWQPGTDHAGIATQMVVERKLAERQLNRRNMGRDAFLQEVWAWKAQSGGAILGQLKRLGASCAFARERFTMDEGLSRAVRMVFVRLHSEGLIYRDKRLVNWDPHFESAISDLEVENRDVKGTMWRIAYPLIGDPVANPEPGSEPVHEIVVATTRPETLLADQAVAVHPADPRYQALIGRRVRLPLTDREIPIIADDYSDPEKGTGAVKITPAHDFNDFKVGRRHDLPLLNIFDSRARLNENAPATFQGLDRFEARERVLHELETLGLMRGADAQDMTQPFGDRSGVVIEPWLTDQWYVDAQKLAIPAIAAVEDGRTEFVPKNWEKTYFEWLRNIEPWCISRQLWWGHRIPAYYGPDQQIFVALTREEAQAEALKTYGRAVELVEDEDVLDTWFSSALWPFSTLGWPDKTAELARFYPTTTLVTAFDIIFFWVARMMMMGLHFMGDVPFKTVYVHALVRDAKGQKMAKSKGNVIDPLELVDVYGADALRFTLASMAAQGRDIKLSTDRVEGYRNFGTKLWNAARFCQMNECALWAEFDPASARENVNRWIAGEVAQTAAKVTQELEALRFNEAANALYRFIWNIYCDWYLELIKPLLQGDDETAKTETRQMAAWVLDQALILLHPISPFITEELWQRTAEFGAKRSTMLIAAPWPDYPGSLMSPDASEEIDWVIRLVSEIRSVRAEMNIPPSARLPLQLIGANAQDSQRLRVYRDWVERLARLESCVEAAFVPAGALQFVHEGAVIALGIAGFVDLAAESQRLQRALKTQEDEITRIDRKLENPQFIAKAPPELIEEQREKRGDYEAARDKLRLALDRIRALG